LEKPIKYAEIPSYFDQTKHYVEQQEPVDMGEYIFIDVVVKDLDLSPTEPTEHQEQIHIPTENERLEAVEQALSALMGV
jgi:hypothetical protein